MATHSGTGHDDRVRSDITARTNRNITRDRRERMPNDRPAGRRDSQSGDPRHAFRRLLRHMQHADEKRVIGKFVPHIEGAKHWVPGDFESNWQNVVEKSGANQAAAVFANIVQCLRHICAARPSENDDRPPHGYSAARPLRAMKSGKASSAFAPRNT